MEMQAVDLNEIVSDAIGLIRPESARRGITIETALATELPACSRR